MPRAWVLELVVGESLLLGDAILNDTEGQMHH